uniref:GDSL esterase/lipase n=1 Tax=Oryza meridionalis TaxID=40149 RepID=A0A0E0C5D2_9ORYZ
MASSISGRRGRGRLLSPAAVVLEAVAVLLSASQALAAPCYPRVFSFGDSLADTGNGPFLYGNDSRRPSLGTNFAVGGATALSPDFFRERGMHVRDTVHLDMEMNWFRDLLAMLCPDDLAGMFVYLLDLILLFTLV